ncbi:Membrane-bound lytic murein transglycosylase C [BD1-7 clade bacterium]|uniref:Membrane-bound lytic murein transglycosylase C n=1 Tax=BD1-7 clade bacterium TaxID=2029982 RepID=A0A5S9MPV0_9GAMM|nr:Membrane-bound lytic murein transglycosylase C [BD1-7 clade bacterium]CAA0084894.1 Membrane-bound lytic murein transglycosylase C [BD1-7 clade bacterium]
MRSSLNQFIRLLLIAISLGAFCAQAAGKPSHQQERDELRAFLKQTIAESSSFTDKFEAEVWLVSQSARLRRYIKDHEHRLSLLKAIHREAKKASLNPDIVLAVIQIESAFDNYAISRVGAQGLMQVMPFWKNEIGRPEDNLTHIDTNLSYGCRILQYYIQREKGKGGLSMALARYNGSYPRTVYTEKVMNAWQGRWDTGP